MSNVFFLFLSSHNIYSQRNGSRISHCLLFQKYSVILNIVHQLVSIPLPPTAFQKEVYNMLIDIPKLVRRKHILEKS